MGKNFLIINQNNKNYWVYFDDLKLIHKKTSQRKRGPMIPSYEIKN